MYVGAHVGVFVCGHVCACMTDERERALEICLVQVNIYIFNSRDIVIKIHWVESSLCVINYCMVFFNSEV